MRPARAAAVLLLPALAFAQEGAGTAAKTASSTGTLLLDALPAEADLVVQTSDLPRFLASAADAGIGTPAAWREAFREQLRRWAAGRGDEAALTRAAEALLATADGEAVVASMLLPRTGTTTPRRRATLVAFRSSRPEAELRAAADEIVRAGLRLRWSAEPRAERIWGRPVTVLAGTFDALTVHVAPGLVVATDDELALRLLFRGMDAATRGPVQKVRDPTTLVVRHHLPGARWEGATFLGAENVSFPATAPPSATTFHRPAESDVMTLALGRPEDVPLFPVRLPDDSPVTEPGAGAFAVTLRGDGTFSISRPAGGGASGSSGGSAAAGGAPHLGWLRALSSGALTTPDGPFDAEVFASPLAAAVARKDAPAVHVWNPGDGSVRGPAWHGPATMLMLRTLAHVVAGRAPGAAPPPEVPAPPKPGRPPSPPPPERK